MTQIVWIGIFIVLFSGVAFFLGRDGAIMPLIIFGGMVGALVIMLEPNIGIWLLMASVPLQGTTLMNQQFAGIPGFKLSNLLPVFVIFAILMTNEFKPYSLRDNVLMLGVVLIFTVAIILSMQYVGDGTTTILFEEKYTPVKYLLSFWFRPMLFMAMLWILSVFRRDKKHLWKIFVYFQWSIFIFSVYIIYLYIFFVPDKQDFENIRDKIGEFMGLHGNNIADFYILGFPALLAYLFMKKNMFSFLNILFALVAVAVTYSRSAYYTIIIELILYVVLTKRKRFLPFFAIILVTLVLLLPKSVLDRALTGVGSNDANEISAGRTELIWYPLIKELQEKPIQLIFGGGRFAITNTDVYRQHRILDVGHAHNMYLDTVLDVGLVGLGFLLVFYLSMMWRMNLVRLKNEDQITLEISTCVMVAIIGFFIRGVSDGCMMPIPANVYIWIQFGIGYAVLYTMEAEKKQLHKKSEGSLV